MGAHEILTVSTDRHIAYHRLSAQGDGANLPGIMFLGGFRSDMTGNKARYLEDWARQHGRAFVRFDYSGHGASSGDFLDECIGEWTDDAAAVFEQLTHGPQILVGSSMGGWIALLLARRYPERMAGLIGVAAAPDFTEDGMWQTFSHAQKATLRDTGAVALTSDYSDDPYVITRKLIEDGRNHLLLRAPIMVTFPVFLLHGTADVDVPMSVALGLLDRLEGPQTRLTIVKDADHRFSGPRELSLIGKALAEFTA